VGLDRPRAAQPRPHSKEHREIERVVKLVAAFGNTSIGLDFGRIAKLVGGLEEVGFDGVSTNDHVIGADPDRSDGVTMNTVHTAVHEPIVLLSMIAAVTQRLELVTSILISPQRQTVLLAKQTAQLGVGRNWIEYESLGEDFTTRGRRMEEQVEVLRLLWGNDLVTYDGRFHQLDRVGINPRSVRDSIPIWMGSYGQVVHEPVLERIGRMADGWMPQFPPDVLAPLLKRVRGYAEGAGRDPNAIGVECSVRADAEGCPGEWRRVAEEYQVLGATHLKASTPMTVGVGVNEQLDVLSTWYEAVAPVVGDSHAEPGGPRDAQHTRNKNGEDR
jgi:probable F420-dependent oxidoreductase